MSAHEGVSCDTCGKSNFRSKRYKCLICYDYDLCSTCYEQGETSSNHASEHPMQCILTRHDFELYYHGERYTSEQAQSYTCPFCGDMGFSYPFLNDSSQTVDLFQHLQQKHVDEQQSNEVICPICASMTNGEPNLMSGDLLAHIANEHQHHQVQTPSTPGTTLNPYARQTSSARDLDFTSSSVRANFRRGPLRTPSRRGTLGSSSGGRGGGTVSQHFVVDTSSTNHGSDPIADLLTQLSTVRRLAAANNSSSSSTTSNSIHLQTLTRQQYERERLRASGRSTQNPPTQTTSSNVLSNVENDFFDSLFSSALVIEPPSPTTNSQQTWAQIVAQQQQAPPPPPPPAPTSDQQQSSALLTTKISGIESEPSLLRKLCEESSSSCQSNNSQKRKNDFVQNIFLASLLSSFNDNDK